MTTVRGAISRLAPLTQRDRHRFIVAFGASCILLVHAAVGVVDLATTPMLAAGIIIVFGLPHGALDVMVAGMHRDFADRPTLVMFLVQYVATAVVVALVWWQFQAIGLAGFLALSAIHFGGDWSDAYGKAERATIGAALLAATTLVHQSQVIAIFGWLAPPAAAGIVGHVLSLTALVAVPVLVIAVLRTFNCKPLASCEVIATIACAVLLPPITFFVLYFCLLHSVRHSIEIRTALARHSSTDLARNAAPYALVASAACLAGSAAFLHLSPGQALLSSVFVVLSALTVPHMILVEWTRSSA
jgi:beta-carotene 15,15'-dioxygenase